MTGAVGCIVLFLLPFAGVGVFAAVQAVRMVALGDWGQAAFFGLFAITFGGVGVGGSSRSRGDAAGSPRRRPRRLDIPTSPGCGGRTGPRAGSRTATARRRGSPGPSRRSGTW